MSKLYILLFFIFFSPKINLEYIKILKQEKKSVRVVNVQKSFFELQIFALRKGTLRFFIKYLSRKAGGAEVGDCML